MASGSSPDQNSPAAHARVTALRQGAGRRAAALLLGLSCGTLVAADRNEAKQDGTATKKGDPSTMSESYISAEHMREHWILDGEAELTVVGEHELKIAATKAMALWCPTVYEGSVTVEFDCMVPEPKTKLLLLAYGHGSDDAAVSSWARDGSYDGYNAGRMEVYTIAFNRGPHITEREGDQFTNVRRIGGPDFAIYTGENFRKYGKEGRDFWEGWNTLSLVGGGLEPVRGLGTFLHYRVEMQPPHMFMSVDGTRFLELVDQRPKPLRKGCFGFRCMSRGRTFIVRNVVIRGEAAGGAGGD